MVIQYVQYLGVVDNSKIWIKVPVLYNITVYILLFMNHLNFISEILISILYCMPSETETSLTFLAEITQI